MYIVTQSKCFSYFHSIGPYENAEKRVPGSWTRRFSARIFAGDDYTTTEFPTVTDQLYFTCLWFTRQFFAFNAMFSVCVYP